jgi:hypothetical protein
MLIVILCAAAGGLIGLFVGHVIELKIEQQYLDQD